MDGRSFSEFVGDEILEPLGMSSSVLRDDQGTLLPAQATGYAPDGDGGWVVDGSAWQQTGDGALHATATDLLAWAEVFLDAPADGDGLGSPTWREVMLTPGPILDDDGTGYGGGVELRTGTVAW